MPAAETLTKDPEVESIKVLLRYANEKEAVETTTTH